MSRFMQLSNGVIFNLDTLSMIARKDLNEFQIVVNGCPLIALADLHDLDAIRSELGMDLVIVEREPDKPLITKLENED